MSVTGVLRRIKDQPRGRLTALVGGLALLVAAPFGGLAPVPLAERVPAVEPGESVDLAPFRVTIDRAVAVDEIGTVSRASGPSHHLMVVLMDVTNTTEEWVYSHLLSPSSRATSYQWRNLVVLDDDLVPSGPASFHHVEDDSRVSVLNPGLTYRLAMVWEFEGPVPDELPLGLATLSHDPLAISQDVLEWSHPTETATLTLPVEDRTEDPA